ncbi:phosphoribosylamine--glycine ligase [Bartonella sp. DGB2]|uniref:phosphoribosylamine--glycine ligase n=1 Tax=Bartonella sp. DGB2 TaxID=3388426 RepID=UPI0039903915
MNVLLIGSGGREHALAWKISTSPLLKKLYCAPGNPGTSRYGESVTLTISDHALVIDFCRKHAIDLVVIGPEGPLVAGICDALRKAGIACFGPSQKAAALEGSKGFTKDLCRDYNIPTGAYQRFNDPQAAKAYIRQQGVPIVVKADGLAAGKGVVVAHKLEDAYSAIDACFSGAFGEAGSEIIVEAFLSGEEASFFCLCDGHNILPLTSAQDHKQVGDGDTGPNTGGMGAYSPAPIMDEAMTSRTLEEIVKPAIQGMAERGAPFCGVLFVGLMITNKGPELIEFNARFGDPECQVLMMRLKDDLLPLLYDAAYGRLAPRPLKWDDKAALTVVMAAKGYPDTPQKGSTIRGLEKASRLEHVMIFHAGTKVQEGAIIANSGRVLNVTATGTTVSEAQRRAYQAIAVIDWPQGFCRQDIGWRAVAREKKAFNS